ncbi:hypothetical protein [Candidatus Darwinibacter acetoxidans]
MNKERWTKQKILQTCLYLIPKKNPETLNTLLAVIERERRYFSKPTFYKKIRPDSKEYQQIVEAIEDNNLYLSAYGINKLKVLVDNYNLKAIVYWLRIYGSDKVKQALSRNYNVTAKADISFEQEMKKVEEDLSKFSKEELLQYRALRKKLLNNE